ncbi:TenA family protein [Lichenifustis flavocetrariae]|uniref:TenA family protein n=1 Tax=Lichenifustis flavocetrariae TaxID=2949735 RepID=A0AA41YRB2_9HYPH|nr:TenA family protein [Lichenifustis flavocetrariae]MCW6507124.1 TenA family protein [Lichenifustis flavocetrariae]
MPFNRELMAGTLRQGVFQHYMIQDAHYLIVFAQALAVAAAKADTPSLILQLSESAATAVAVERDLHDRYFRQFGLNAEQVTQTEMSPTCHHYCAFLLATAFREPLPVLLAALLPCFWIYREVGRHIFGSAAPDNPYRAWIDTYASPEFATAVDRMIEATDLLAAPASAAIRESMDRVFTRAVQFEWMFWDSAYRLEQWPVSL